MEHWFDRLSQPHTRRSALKAGLAALSAGVALPAFRPQLAYGTDREPCFLPCMAAVVKRANESVNGCEQLDALRHFNVLNAAHAPGGALTEILEYAAFAGCLASSELGLAAGALGCRAEECGDRAKYPGGTVPPPAKPKPVCDPITEALCVDVCCSVTSICCPGSEPKCWSTNHVC